MIPTSSTSCLRALCPAARIVLLLLAFLWMVAFVHPLTALLPFFTALGGVALARGWPQLRKLAPLLALLMVMTALIWTLLSPGGIVLLQLGSLRITAEGTSFALAMSLRISGMLMAGIAFIAVTSVEELRRGLHQLGLPYPVAFAIGLSFRLQPVISAMLHTTIEAQQIRGHLLNEGGPIRRFRNYAPLIIPVILLSLRNSDRMAMAIAARGYGCPGPRTDVLDHPWRSRDTLVIAVALAVLLLTLYCRLRWSLM